MIKSMMRFRFLFAFALILQLVAVPLQSSAEESVTPIPIDYLALGDSLAFGINSDNIPGEGYTDYLAATLKVSGELKSFNKGFSAPGYTSDNVLQDLKDNVTKPVLGEGYETEEAELLAAIEAAEVITISAGANDVLAFIELDEETNQANIDLPGLMTAIQKVGGNYKQIMDQIYEINPNVQVYVMGYYNPFPHHSDEALQSQLTTLLGALNGGIQTGIAETDAVIVHTAAKIAEDYLAYLPNPKNIHLSEEGYKVVAALFAEAFLEKNTEQPGEPTEPDPPMFLDIESSYFKEFIEQAASLELIEGHKDGTFQPSKSLTRTQAASIIVRTLNLTADEPAPFPDITGYAVKTQAEIAAAYQYGIVKGSNGNFMPSKPVTRAQLALMMMRAYEMLTQESYVATDVPPFSDISGLHDETKTAVAFVSQFNIANGSNGKYMPSNPTNRGQAAKMFVNFAALAN